MNSVKIMGRLTRDPELRYLQSNTTSTGDFIVALDKELQGQNKSTRLKDTLQQTFQE